MEMIYKARTIRVTAIMLMLITMLLATKGTIRASNNQIETETEAGEEDVLIINPKEVGEEDEYITNPIDLKDDGEYITRATGTVIIGKMIAGNSNIKQIVLPFIDVPDDAYYRKYVCLLYQYKIVSGTSENTFSPNRIITKEELLTMMGRTAELLMHNKVNPTDTSVGKFTDAALISNYAKPYVELMREQGLLRTIGLNRNLNPKAKITESQGIILTSHLFILINSKPITNLFM